MHKKGEVGTSLVTVWGIVFFDASRIMMLTGLVLNKKEKEGECVYPRRWKGTGFAEQGLTEAPRVQAHPSRAPNWPRPEFAVQFRRPRGAPERSRGGSAQKAKYLICIELRKQEKEEGIWGWILVCV